MNKLELGDSLPSLDVHTTQGTRPLSDLRLQKECLVLYFYPKDDTPGCTQEAQEFRDALREFKKYNASVIGVSRDTLQKHEKFCQKHDLPFPLISDTDESLCQLFEVLKEKNMYGKKVMGIERSTFVFDRQGQLHKAWRKVKVNGHVDEVLSVVKDL